MTLLPQAAILHCRREALLLYFTLARVPHVGATPTQRERERKAVSSTLASSQDAVGRRTYSGPTPTVRACPSCGKQSWVGVPPPFCMALRSSSCCSISVVYVVGRARWRPRQPRRGRKASSPASLRVLSFFRQSLATFSNLLRFKLPPPSQ